MTAGAVVELRPRAEAFCIFCDAPRGTCPHSGPHYLSPIRYEPVVVAEGSLPRWGVPAHERDRFDAPPSTWARPAQRPAPVDADRSPFLCAGCEATLSSWARLRGFTFCSRECRERRATRA